MARTAIVTDSSCDLSPEELRELGVRCVNIGVSDAQGNPFPDDNTPGNVEAFYDHVESCRQLPKTSAPSPVAFAELYSELAREGYTDIVSVHLPLAMSGTVEAARIAAQSAAVPVAVVDAHRNTWGLALLVRCLSHMRSRGARFRQLADMARKLHSKCNIVFSVNSLRNLVKGGRTGKATGLAATILDIKPVLTVDDDGEVVQLAKVRSMKRALSKLADIAEELQARLGSLEGYFVHVRNEEAADRLREHFHARGIAFRELGVRQVGPTIATHVGIGTVGFAYIAEDA